ncbi:hypothetical protein D3093_35145 (plasmid) [Azospirillum argentinense]|uniref:Uncharacterized protein n=1 Tax=Azospirillum argentinense TaxID=2970906 RepID=A0A4D8PPR0_9PROT|nr:hypothetical protein [Azospirillum argentinense]QCO00484.1 hypothetical protein D3093_35145 [Azospirillum argentinense]
MDQNQTQPNGQPKYIIHADAANAAMNYMCSFRSLGVAGDEEVCSPYSPELRAHLQAVLGPLPLWAQRGTEPVQNLADYLRALADVLAPPVAAEAQGTVEEEAPVPEAALIEPAPTLSPVDVANHLLTIASGRYIRPERWEPGAGQVRGEPRLAAWITVEVASRSDNEYAIGAFVTVKAYAADFHSVEIARGLDYDAVIAEAKEKLVALPTTVDVEEPVVEAPSAPEAPVPSEVA